ncbi:MAG: flagellar hook-basal body complex protein, partial [Campylobacterota bacterium]|nr:flagellar hook-basal body complex protein [Campylobacterota bacterium]
MVGSLWTGISGMSTHQAALDNESHNIANVNTIGYKSSRISFADQMYQDSIGKGSKVVDAEKLYTQGGMKSTGNSYDVALQGSGFFVVKDPNATGTSEEFYTRAGNFRMGESGTLQDANSFDVVGWSMSPIDTANDISSTNSNITSFNNDYSKLAGNQIIKKDGVIETITSKLTDYASLAQSDDPSVMSGLGYKSTSAKVNGVEALIADYQAKLKSYAANPTGPSSTSSSQVSTVSLPDSTASQMSTSSDQVYVYIDGKKYTQNYIEVTTSLDHDNADGDNDSTTGAGEAGDNQIASKIATYKALADQLSQLPWAKAYITDPTTVATSPAPVEGSEASYANAVATNPNITIESLIPGEEFIVGESAEYISTTASKIPGSDTTNAVAMQGTGFGAVESSKTALLTAAAGLQRDVWSSSDLVTNGDPVAAADYTFTNPNTGVATTVSATAGTTQELIDDLVTKINADSNMNTDIKAHNYNGNLVVETIESNPGGSFVASLKSTALLSGDTANTGNINKNSDLSINSGTDAEFLSMTNTLNQTSSKDSIQLKLDNLGISDSPFGEFEIDESGLITMKQDGASFAIGQVSVALFSNETGLSPQGNNMLSKTITSGEPIYAVNNDKAAGIIGRTLELSTSDLSTSLVNLMVYQRAFEANSKSISTSDQLLTTLIQLKK